VVDALAADAETHLLNSEVRAVVRAAAHEAIASLTPRERALMRYLLLEGRSQDVVAKIFGVTRATVARWWSDAQAKVIRRTRDRTREQMGDDVPALASIDLSLSRILGGE
jgi:RNA polymerase sigma factor (sigma-70 family)